MADVGTGAGFPGLPLRILEPSIRLTLLDALQKRITFLQGVCDDLGLDDVACVHGRAEEFAQAHRESFDLLTSRAVADLQLLSELCLAAGQARRRVSGHEVRGMRTGTGAGSPCH